MDLLAVVKAETNSSPRQRRIDDISPVCVPHTTDCIAAECLEGVLAARGQPCTVMKMTNSTKIVRSNIQRRPEDEKLDFAFP